jgi:hypothetical protein
MKRTVKAWAGLNWDTLEPEEVRFGPKKEAVDDLRCGDFHSIIPVTVTYDDGKAKKRGKK